MGEGDQKKIRATKFFAEGISMWLSRNSYERPEFVEEKSWKISNVMVDFSIIEGPFFENKISQERE